MHDRDRKPPGPGGDAVATPTPEPGRSPLAAPTIYRDGDGPVDAAASAPVDRALGAAGQGTPHPQGAILHTDSVASEAAAAVGARAFTAGNDIYFGAGQFNLGTPSGDALLTHELTHVEQARDVAPPTPGNYAISDPGQREEVEARSAAAGGDMVPGAAAPATIFRDTDTAGTETEEKLTPLLGHKIASAVGAHTGNDANIAEAKDAGASDEDALQKFRLAIHGGDPVAVTAAWSAVPRKQRSALKDETDTILRMMQVWGAPSLVAMRQIGIELDSDKRFIQHVLWQSDVATWKQKMSGGQWRDFLHGDPKKGDLDQASLAGLGQAIKATSDQGQDKTLFEKAFPPLITNAANAGSDWWKFESASEWTHARIVRLYDALTGDALPVGHIAAASAGFLMARRYKSRNLNTDPWPKRWSNLGFALWVGDTPSVVFPTTSAGRSGGGTDHDMVGGTQSDSASPATAASHWTSSALHEIGHAVGQNIEGNTWAATTGPAQFTKYPNTGGSLTTLCNDMWDPALVSEPTGGAPKLAIADAKAVLREQSTTGAMTPPAGFTDDTLFNELNAQYGNQPFLKLVFDNLPEGENAYTAPVHKDPWTYAFLSRWGGAYAKYAKAAHDGKVSMYSLSSPNEWFAEQYSQYYRTGKAGTGLDPATKTFLDALDRKPFVDPAAAAAAGPRRRRRHARRRGDAGRRGPRRGARGVAGRAARRQRRALRMVVVMHRAQLGLLALALGACASDGPRASPSGSRDSIPAPTSASKDSTMATTPPPLMPPATAPGPYRRRDRAHRRRAGRRRLGARRASAARAPRARRRRLHHAEREQVASDRGVHRRPGRRPHRHRAGRGRHRLGRRHRRPRDGRHLPAAGGLARASAAARRRGPVPGPDLRHGARVDQADGGAAARPAARVRRRDRGRRRRWCTDRRALPAPPRGPRARRGGRAEDGPRLPRDPHRHEGVRADVEGRGRRGPLHRAIPLARMSIVDRVRLPCACGTPLEVMVADSVNAVRHPHLREAALAATLHRFTCAVCGRITAVDQPFLYVDFDRRQFFGVRPARELDAADGHARAIDEVFERTMLRDAPVAVRARAGEFMVRICFGLDELRDKLVVEQHGLDDLVVEEVKCRVLASDPRFWQAGVLTLWLVDVAPTGELLMLPSDHGGGTMRAPVPPVVVERALYDEAAALGRDAIRAARRGIAVGTHVSLLRLARAA